MDYILGPYVSGPTQMVWRTLPTEDMASYAKLKEELLDWYGMTEDSFRHCFCTVRYTCRTCPQAVLGELREAATRWLKPTTDKGRTIVENVALDQAYHIMPPEVLVWVLRYCPLTLAKT